MGILTGTLAFFIDFFVDKIYDAKYDIMEHKLSSESVDWAGAYFIVSIPQLRHALHTYGGQTHWSGLPLSS